ncbi:MAG: DUF819 family protein [Saprospiraceae bacterium]|nr:DUF819 family protein [Saprospiraceae bacterium]
MLTLGIIITISTLLLIKWLEKQKTPFIKTILDWFPAILFAYVMPAAVCYISGIDLSQIELHRWSRDFIMPLAILTVMSALSFRQLRVIGIRPIVLFFLGSFAVAVAPVALIWLAKIFLPEWYHLVISQDYWKGLIPIVGSWIGGSTSQLVLKEVVDCPDQLFITMLVMDNVLVNIWTLLMFQFIKKSDLWNKWFKIDDKVPDFIPDQVDLSSGHRKSLINTGLICLLILFLSYFFVPNFLVKILLLSAIGLLLGNVISTWDHAFVLKIGGYLIIMIMAILGLRLNFESFHLPASIVLFAVVWIIIHFIVMLAGAIIMKLHFAWIAIGSMANVGGISTAPAVTAAYNEEWMPYAVILAILSMVSGTTWGLFTIWLMGLLTGM